MSPAPHTAIVEPTSSRKVGAEDIVMIRLPAERIRRGVPNHCEPLLDDRSRCQVALLAQACRRVSFDRDEVGPSDELHLWLQTGTEDPDLPVEGADVMLPSMHWVALGSAASSGIAREYFRSFGLCPLDLHTVTLREDGGSLALPAGGRIDWTIARPGRRMPSAGVHHVIFVPTDGPDAPGHRVSALLKGAVLNQMGTVRIRTDAFEPILLRGESLPAVIHRMSALRADVIWQRHPSEQGRRRSAFQMPDG